MRWRSGSLENQHPRARERRRRRNASRGRSHSHSAAVSPWAALAVRTNPGCILKTEHGPGEPADPILSGYSSSLRSRDGTRALVGPLWRPFYLGLTASLDGLRHTLWPSDQSWPAGSCLRRARSGEWPGERLVASSHSERNACPFPVCLEWHPSRVRPSQGGRNARNIIPLGPLSDLGAAKRTHWPRSRRGSSLVPGNFGVQRLTLLKLCRKRCCRMAEVDLPGVLGLSPGDTMDANATFGR